SAGEPFKALTKSRRLCGEGGTGTPTIRHCSIPAIGKLSLRRYNKFDPSTVSVGPQVEQACRQLLGTTASVFLVTLLKFRSRSLDVPTPLGTRLWRRRSW